MDDREIVALRVRSQQLIGQTARMPAAVVARLGALQAQDYAGALWSVAMRMAEGSTDATEAGVERALADGSIVRSWPMRRTLHLVEAADLRWMLALLAPRALAAAARNRALLGVTDGDVARSRELFTRALEGGRRLTREDMLATLDAGGVTTAGQRGYHILVNLAMAGLLCLGPRAGKQQTYVLLDEWAPPTPPLDREEALGKLATRYFTGHGPAAVQDLARWAGMTTGDARTGVAVAGTALVEVKVGKSAFLMSAEAADGAPPAPPRALLLPGFDEYLLGYADRSAAIDAAHEALWCPGGNGVFKPFVVADGRAVGLWARKLKKKSVEVTLEPFTDLDADVMKEVEAQAEKYGRFLGLEAVRV